jgi:hypothetical protein
VFVRRFGMLLRKRRIIPEQLTIKRATELVSDNECAGNAAAAIVALKFVEHLIDIGVASSPTNFATGCAPS